MSELDLKPCPFCGGEVKMIRFCDAYELTYMIECKKCRATSNMLDTQQEFADVWNTRDEAAGLELRPCPICGGEAVITTDNDHAVDGKVYKVYIARCSNCDTATFRFNTREEAAAAWNRRAGE